MVAPSRPRVASPDEAIAVAHDPPGTIIVAGDDAAARDRVTHALREAIGTAGFRLLSGEDFPSSAGGAAAVAAELGAMNLLAAERRLIHVRRADALVGGKTASDVAIPHGRSDAILLWETEDNVHASSGALAPSVSALCVDPASTLIVDCSVPIGRAFAEHVRARAAEWGCRLADDAVRALEALARTDPSAVDRVVTAVAASVGEGEAHASDVDDVRVATRDVSPEFLRALSAAVSASEAAESLQMWARAGTDRGDPAPALGYIAGGLLSGLEKGYGARRTARRTADLIDALRWTDSALKSGVRDRDAPYAYLVAHLSGVDQHRSLPVRRARR